MKQTVASFSTVLTIKPRIEHVSIIRKIASHHVKGSRRRISATMVCVPINLLFPGLFPKGKALKTRLCAILQHLAIRRTAREKLFLLKRVFFFKRISVSYHVHHSHSLRNDFFPVLVVYYYNTFASIDTCKKNPTATLFIERLVELRRKFKACVSFFSFLFFYQIVLIC